MHTCTIRPRVSEVNGAGHIGNTVFPVWLEECRVEFLQYVLQGKTFPYFLARLEQDFKKEVFLGSDVSIKTVVEKIGNSSLTISQEVWQNNSLCAESQSVLVHIDRKDNLPAPISDEDRSRLKLLTGCR
jgi:acyl-CoA thioester hydrolase